MLMMHSMRTTLTIDDDLVARIEELRRREGLTFKAAVNRLLRAGMDHQEGAPRPRPYRTPTRRLGLRPGFDPTRLNQVADELEVESALGGREDG